jgi:hypothetical protein
VHTSCDSVNDVGHQCNQHEYPQDANRETPCAVLRSSQKYPEVVHVDAKYSTHTGGQGRRSITHCCPLLLIAIRFSISRAGQARCRSTVGTTVPTQTHKPGRIKGGSFTDINTDSRMLKGRRVGEEAVARDTRDCERAAVSWNFPATCKTCPPSFWIVDSAALRAVCPLSSPL